MEISFTIPGEPVAKGRPRLTKTGRAFTPAKTRSYENLVKIQAAEAMKGAAPFGGAVILHVTAFLPIPNSWSGKKKDAARSGDLRPLSRPDLDNHIKAVSDGMNGIVYRDDSQIVTIAARKFYSDRPRLQVRVECPGDEAEGVA